MNHLAINLLIRAAAGRFGLVVSEKFLSQAVPVAGAVAGGALNYAFTDYYQTMARVHFCLRALERRTGDPRRSAPASRRWCARRATAAASAGGRNTARYFSCRARPEREKGSRSKKTLFTLGPCDFNAPGPA